jgi:hypothetical protein
MYSLACDRNEAWCLVKSPPLPPTPQPKRIEVGMLNSQSNRVPWSPKHMTQLQHHPKIPLRPTAWSADTHTHSSWSLPPTKGRFSLHLTGGGGEDDELTTNDKTVSWSLRGWLYQQTRRSASRHYAIHERNCRTSALCNDGIRTF